MEKQSALAYCYLQTLVQPSLSLFGILKDAYKTFLRNGRLLFFITFIIFSTDFILELGDRFIVSPIGEDFDAHVKLLPNNGTILPADLVSNKAIIKDVRHFLVYLLVSLSFCGLIFVLSVTASVHSTFEAYTAKVLSLKDTLIGTVRGKWKRAFKTSICIVLISLASAALLFFVFGLIGVMAEGSVLSALNWGVIILGGCYGVYLCSIWMVSLVVSVIEDDLSGLKAINEASELMKGKELQGFVLMGIMILAGVAISKAFYYLGSKVNTTQNETLGLVIGLAISVPENLAFCLLQLFVFVVFTLFYHGCKMNKIAEENRNLYVPIAAVSEF